MTLNSEMVVADTIREQIGRSAFFMMGTQHIVRSDKGIRFNIRGCSSINWVCVELNGLDLYDVTFQKVTKRGLDVRVVASFDNLSSEQLRPVIEQHTGLLLSL